MRDPDSIYKWQKEFRAAPVIYFTTVKVDGAEEDTGNFYATREAAQYEVDHRKGKCQIRQANIHSEHLSKTRWGGFNQ